MSARIYQGRLGSVDVGLVLSTSAWFCRRRLGSVDVGLYRSSRLGPIDVGLYRSMSASMSTTRKRLRLNTLVEFEEVGDKSDVAACVCTFLFRLIILWLFGPTVAQYDSL